MAPISCDLTSWTKLRNTCSLDLHKTEFLLQENVIFENRN